MTECMICQHDDEDGGPTVYVVEKPRGTMTICEECDAEPYHCNGCGNDWMYGGDAERPTCPNCRGKKTDPVL